MSRKLTKELVASVAKQFNTRRAFELGDASAYKAARKNGWLDELCIHMTSLRTNWTKDSVAAIASKFSTRNEFQLGNCGAHRAARINGWLDDVCSHMQPGYKTLSKNLVSESALKFETRTDFQIGHPSAYQAARKNGWLPEVCAHMPQALGGFDTSKSGYLYQIKIILPTGDNLWKVGITNRNVKYRLYSMGIPAYATYEVTHEVFYAAGAGAKHEEKRLHDIGAKQGICYNGLPLLKNGNTELFIAPLL